MYTYIRRRAPLEIDSGVVVFEAEDINEAYRQRRIYPRSLQGGEDP